MLRCREVPEVPVGERDDAGRFVGARPFDVQTAVGEHLARDRGEGERPDRQRLNRHRHRVRVLRHQHGLAGVHLVRPAQLAALRPLQDALGACHLGRGRFAHAEFEFGPRRAHPRGRVPLGTFERLRGRGRNGIRHEARPLAGCRLCGFGAEVDVVHVAAGTVREDADELLPGFQLRRDTAGERPEVVRGKRADVADVVQRVVGEQGERLVVRGAHREHGDAWVGGAGRFEQVCARAGRVHAHFVGVAAERVDVLYAGPHLPAPVEHLIRLLGDTDREFRPNPGVVSGLNAVGDLLREELRVLRVRVAAEHARDGRRCACGWR